MCCVNVCCLTGSYSSAAASGNCTACEAGEQPSYCCRQYLVLDSVVNSVVCLTLFWVAATTHAIRTLKPTLAHAHTRLCAAAGKSQAAAGQTECIECATATEAGLVLCPCVEGYAREDVGSECVCQSPDSPEFVCPCLASVRKDTCKGTNKGACASVCVCVCVSVCVCACVYTHTHTHTRARGCRCQQCGRNTNNTITAET